MSNAEVGKLLLQEALSGGDRAEGVEGKGDEHEAKRFARKAELKMLIQSNDDLKKLSLKTVVNVQYLGAMNPTAGSFFVTLLTSPASDSLPTKIGVSSAFCKRERICPSSCASPFIARLRLF